MRKLGSQDLDYINVNASGVLYRLTTLFFSYRIISVDAKSQDKFHRNFIHEPNRISDTNADSNRRDRVLCLS